MLFVLDNAYDEAQVSQLLPGAGGGRILVTSRERSTRSQQAYPLSVEGLSVAEAVELFVPICTHND